MKMRVLVVEDEAPVREPMVEFLRYEKVLADGVPDGRQGLEALKTGGYNLCVVDLLMPVMDGEEFIIRAREIKPELKFVVVTGKGMPLENEYRRLAKMPGVVAVLQKPFPLEKLHEAVLKAF